MAALKLTRDQLATICRGDALAIRQFERLFALVDTLSSGSAPVDAPYVMLASDSTLTDERVLTAGTGVSIVDGGAGGPVTISATGGTPSGAAGGSLAGTYPNPSIAVGAVGAAELAASGVAAATYTLATVTVDVDGRVTSAADGWYANPGTTLNVILGDGVNVATAGNLTHNSTTKTTSTSTLVAGIAVESRDLYLNETIGAPSAVANKMVVYVDTDKLKVVRETGTVVQLDAVEVSQAGALISTRKNINFVSGATVADNAGTDSADVTVTGGGGGGTFGQATATFTVNTDSVVVSVVDAGVSAGSNIVPTIGTAPGRDADEFERAPVLVSVASITAGVGFDIIVVSIDGDADGAYLINYTRD